MGYGFYAKLKLRLLTIIIIIIIKSLEPDYSQIEMKALHHWNVSLLPLWEAFGFINRRRTLIWISTEQKLILCRVTARIQRGAITPSVYKYSIKYRPGLQNENADIFSRYASIYIKEVSSSIATNVRMYQICTLCQLY